ncbi:MAG: trp operon repressor [Alphaproteobacteria bacterium]|nr:trp operon repressor [Alphaproteobacteria bacterium]
MISLYQAFSLIKNEQEFRAFLTDLLTPTEMRELNARWRIAQLLWSANREKIKAIPDGGNKKRIKNSKIGLSQKDISQQTGIGLNTISRVSKCLFENKDNGYRSVIGKSGVHHARAA